MTDRQQRIEALEWASDRAEWYDHKPYAATLRAMLDELRAETEEVDHE
jgi:hypothetical protein